MYDRFVGHVAAGRGIEPSRARDLAKGRVWTGTQARERGLVDALGGVETALALAKEAAGIDQAAPVKLVEYPKKKRTLRRRREESSEAAQLLGDGLRAAQPIGAALAATAPQGELVLPAGF